MARLNSLPVDEEICKKVSVTQKIKDELHGKCSKRFKVGDIQFKCSESTGKDNGVLLLSGEV